MLWRKPLPTLTQAPQLVCATGGDVAPRRKPAACCVGQSRFDPLPERPALAYRGSHPKLAPGRYGVGSAFVWRVRSQSLPSVLPPSLGGAVHRVPAGCREPAAPRGGSKPRCEGVLHNLKAGRTIRLGEDNALNPNSLRKSWSQDMRAVEAA